MSSVLRRCLKFNGIAFGSSNTTNALARHKISSSHRCFSDDKSSSDPHFSFSTIMLENGLDVHELPLVIRNLTSIPDDQNVPPEDTSITPDSFNYPLVKEEFMQCLHLRDIFSLLTKCAKITPNIALGAIERIYELEKNPPLSTPMNIPAVENDHINMAKGAILDKLLRVVLKTEDTQSILNILSTTSTFMDPYKPTFSYELLFRVVDNKLSINHLCQYLDFLIKNKANQQYSDTIDWLWIGFFGKEQEIDAQNIVKVFQVLKGLKSSKKTIISLLEKKFAEVFPEISIKDMQDILVVFEEEKYTSFESYSVIISYWVYMNIHAFKQEEMLDIMLKLTRLSYTDNYIEKAVEKYMRLKGNKIDTPILVVAILNYCLQFQIRNDTILDGCCEYFLKNGQNIPSTVLKSIVFPYGYLNFDPTNSSQFWALAESTLENSFNKMNPDDICSTVLSFIYMGKHPLKPVNRLFNPEYLLKINNPQTLKKLYLIDTALSLESSEYAGPLIPKDQCSKPVSQDPQIKDILEKTKNVFESIAGGSEKLSFNVMVPNMHADETYLIDVMIHPTGIVGNTLNRKENVAILIHLPDHYCSNKCQLLGPQVMRTRLLKILGLRVVSLQYSVLNKYYHRSCNCLRQYLEKSLAKPE